MIDGFLNWVIIKSADTSDMFTVSTQNLLVLLILLFCRFNSGWMLVIEHWNNQWCYSNSFNELDDNSIQNNISISYINNIQHCLMITVIL